MKTANIRLGSLDSTAPDVREFGRARDLQNVDIDKSNEVGRRNGYQRRLFSQLSGPVRMLFSFGGLCGRFFQYIDGGGLITLTGEQGSGPLRSELDSDDDFIDAGAPSNPTPGGAGEVTDDDGIVITGSGADRQPGAQEESEGDDESDPDENLVFTFVAEATLLNTVELTWTWGGTNTISGDYVEVYKSTTGYPRPLTSGTLVTRQDGLAGTFTDEGIDEYSTIYYSIVFYLKGQGAYGGSDTSDDSEATFDKKVLKVRSFTVAAPASVSLNTAFDLDIQAVHWTGANDTSYTPDSALTLNIGDSSHVYTPATIPITGWASGAKTQSITITGGDSGSIAITVTEDATGATGTDSATLSSWSIFLNEPFDDNSNSWQNDGGGAPTYSGGNVWVDGGNSLAIDNTSKTMVVGSDFLAEGIPYNAPVVESSGGTNIAIQMFRTDTGVSGRLEARVAVSESRGEWIMLLDEQGGANDNTGWLAGAPTKELTLTMTKEGSSLTCSYNGQSLAITLNDPIASTSLYPRLNVANNQASQTGFKDLKIYE